MSRGNVEIVIEAFAAWNADDMRRLRELYHPDAICRAPPDWPEPGPYVGRRAVMRQFERTREAWDEDSLEFVSDFRAVGDRVVVRARWRMVGHGPAGAIEWTVMYTIRDELVYELEFFFDHNEALKALGATD